ncbi:MAG: phosphatase [Marinilabiliaceae bacterium]|nr:phosphatase [Marinilabiliaceae bacterium]
MRFAIIDIGTNTINLAIASISDKGNNYQMIYSGKEAARLGKGGINEGIMLEDAMERGIEAIGKHAKTIESFNVDHTVAIGTSVMRSVKNADIFAQKIKEKFGIDISIVSGDEEARLIFDGVKQVMPIGSERVLILDIGGGSCEFIIANKDGIIWEHSFELGMSRLLDKFHPSDPITSEEIKKIEAYLRSEMQLLYEALHNYPTQILVGTSGSFDTIATIIAAQKHPAMNIKLSTSYEIGVAPFTEIHRHLMQTTAEQRRAIPKMDKNRVDLVVVGSVFINFVIREMRIEQLYQCSYALKQGAVLQFIEKEIKNKKSE